MGIDLELSSRPKKRKTSTRKPQLPSVFKRNLIVSITSLSAHDKKNIRGKKRRLNEPQGTSRTAKVQNSLQRAHLAIILPPPTSHHQKKKNTKRKNQLKLHVVFELESTGSNQSKPVKSLKKFS
jgi:hypothetical protein